MDQNAQEQNGVSAVKKILLVLIPVVLICGLLIAGYIYRSELKNYLNSLRSDDNEQSQDNTQINSGESSDSFNEPEPINEQSEENSTETIEGISSSNRSEQVDSIRSLSSDEANSVDNQEIVEETITQIENITPIVEEKPDQAPESIEHNAPEPQEQSRSSDRNSNQELISTPLNNSTVNQNDEDVNPQTSLEDNDHILGGDTNTVWRNLLNSMSESQNPYNVTNNNLR